MEPLRQVTAVVLSPRPMRRQPLPFSKVTGETFQEDYVAVVEAVKGENARLLEQKFDYIFLYRKRGGGTPSDGKAAAQLDSCHAGVWRKSPCIVDQDAKLSLAARLWFGKLLNSGQTC